MALGKTHDIVNIAALPVFLYFLPKEFFVPFGAGYILGTFFLSPDLDLPSSRPTKRWKFLRCLWFPYQLLSKHRGVSHMPLIGSLFRLIYLLGTLLFLYFVFLGMLSLLGGEVLTSVFILDLRGVAEDLLRSEKVLYFVAGVVCADLLHITVDILDSLRKKLT
ncbi:MAG TPA: hypothetical protein EYP11_06595 [Aquificaceae bacterium]|nr:hypothetical protein [Aquificaceae bacterium]